MKKCHTLSFDKGASLLLYVFPMKEQNLDLINKNLKNVFVTMSDSRTYLQNVCAVRNCYVLQEMRFCCQLTQQYKNFHTICLAKVCYNVKLGPNLIAITTKQFAYCTANKGDDARLDVKIFGERDK